MQLSFLDDTTTLQEELMELRKTQENVRRGLFQRYGIMQKEMEALRNEIHEVKSKIYKETDGLIEDLGLIKEGA